MKKNKDGKYSASNVAAYIISSFNEKRETLDHLKLQKLLYFVAVKWIGEFGVYPYVQPTEKWKLGPVIRAIYGEYRSNGSGSITKPATTLRMENGKITLEEAKLAKFNEKEKDLVDQVLFEYGKRNSFELVDLTHSHTPWLKEERTINKNNGNLLEYSYDDFKEVLNEL
ncbi:DUF4065 domain-containing protein [Rummeliibacillus sp. G93]|uniref:Panacea domain-containing protein n=1 Tax=Rummeliibacillus sp. G93 TaxID=2939494 RepID=UPI00201C29CE|nr:type II toxin-antitoxin system antitoxin SocA domain-containing protein [Rummeliibacillus sp. G93]UQW98205.1 DUF4065 domain-containing protein [Rummeliibacillus sp. G93]